jgi:hypothetical protein
MNTQHIEHAQQGAPEVSIGGASGAEGVGTQRQQVAEPSATTANTKRTALDVVLARLAALQVGEAIVHERMVVFPLFAQGADSVVPFRYVTLEQAIAQGAVEVTEQPSATVPELLLRNKGDTMIFVLDGEEIIGGRQNRIVNASFLVAANSTTCLPVTCVEHGRWHSTSYGFSSGESSYHSLRREKFAQVRSSLAATGRHTSDQSAVWDSVARKAMDSGTHSLTGAMNEIYQSRGVSLDGYLRAFPYLAGAVGFAVALGGRMAGADLFDQPETASVLWPKLVRSYAMDALDSPEGGAVERQRAVRLIERARGARGETYPSLALGEDVRFDGDGMVGGGLVYQETPVHITLFRTHGGESASQSGTMARASQRRTAFMQRSPQQRDQNV